MSIFSDYPARRERTYREAFASVARPNQGQNRVACTHVELIQKGRPAELHEHQSDAHLHEKDVVSVSN